MLLGVYVKFGAVPDKVPLEGLVSTLYVNGLPSISDPVNVIDFAVSSLVVTLWAFATGVSFIGLIVIFNVVSTLLISSNAFTVILSSPCILSSG